MTWLFILEAARKHFGWIKIFFPPNGHGQESASVGLGGGSPAYSFVKNPRNQTLCPFETERLDLKLVDKKHEERPCSLT